MKKIVSKIITLSLIAALTAGCIVGCENQPTVQVSATQSGETEAKTEAKTEDETAVPTEDETDKENTSSAEKTKVSADYFDDAVFVGDSITVSFSMYVEAQRAEGIDCLGDAYVLASASLGYINSFLPIDDDNCVLPMYQGVQQPLEDSIAQIGAKKVYIMLGMNDIVQASLETTMRNAEEAINNIKAKSPDAEIYIESVTPMIESAQYDGLNNEKIREFNGIMKDFADENGYPYLDIYSVVADENGNLKEEYCSDPDDMGMHFLFNADALWEKYLLNHPDGK